MKWNLPVSPDLRIVFRNCSKRDFFMILFTRTNQPSRFSLDSKEKKFNSRPLRELTTKPQIHNEHKIVCSVIDFYEEYCVFILKESLSIHLAWQDVDGERKEGERDGSRERKRGKERERGRQSYLVLTCVRHFWRNDFNHCCRYRMPGHDHHHHHPPTPWCLL